MRRKALVFACLAAAAAVAGRARAADPEEPIVAPRAPEARRYAWTNNKWTGFGASIMSSGLVMAGGAGLALHAEPRPGNDDEDRFYHLLGIGLFCTSATSLVTSPILTSIHTAAQPDAPLPSTAFFVGAGTIAVGGGIVGVATLALLGEDARDSPWDDARGVAIITGAMITAFGVGIALIGATDSGVPGARRPWQKQARARGTSASLRLGPGSAFVTGEMF
jgi:hypothetical protein